MSSVDRPLYQFLHLCDRHLIPSNTGLKYLFPSLQELNYQTILYRFSRVLDRYEASISHGPVIIASNLFHSLTMKSNGAAHGGHYVRISDHLTATPATESDRNNIIEPKRTKRDINSQEAQNVVTIATTSFQR